MIIIFTGGGKGKTTAALGQALRSVGEGKKVLMVQFIKGPWKSGEDESAKRLEPEFKIIKTGLGFVGILGDKLPREEHIKAAMAGLELAKREIESGNWDTVILDEINNAVSIGLMPEGSVVKLFGKVGKKPEHLILTGRNAPEEFLKRADMITKMKDVRHPYDKGIKAKRGLEY